MNISPAAPRCQTCGSNQHTQHVVDLLNVLSDPAIEARRAKAPRVSR